MDPRHNVLDELDREECLKLLATQSIGRLVFTAEAMPAIRPVTYVLGEDDVIVVRTRAGTGVAKDDDGSVVAFQVDNLDETNRTGWSVSVVGRARLLDAGDARYREDDRPAQWLPETDALIELDTCVLHGERVRRR